MANICISLYVITGDKSELHSLYRLMKKLQKEKEYGNWLGYIIEALNHGEIPQHLYVRGEWNDLKLNEDHISFNLESAWEPLYEAWDFICSKYSTLSAYFSGEESACEVYLKRDSDNHEWFPFNYIVDTCTPSGEYRTEYFCTIDEAFRFIETLDDVNIITAEDIEALDLKWQEDNEDAYIYLHEFKEV